MAFLETPRFPEKIRFDVVGGVEFSTNIIVVNSGFESRNKNWASAKGAWKLSHGPHNRADTDALIAFFRAVGGRAHGFRFKDWGDYKVAFGEGRFLPLAVTNGVPLYQMVRRYQQGALLDDRKITKPVSGTISVQRNGALVPQGVQAGNFNLDPITGIIGFAPDATASVAAITLGAQTVVTLASPLALVAGQWVYISGAAGADATIFGGQPHQVVSVAGNSCTLATNTSGKAITVASAAVAVYPQPADALVWSGEFDVPARFDTDKMELQVVAPDLYQWMGIGIVEIRL